MPAFLKLVWRWWLAFCERWTLFALVFAFAAGPMLFLSTRAKPTYKSSAVLLLEGTSITTQVDRGAIEPRAEPPERFMKKRVTKLLSVSGTRSVLGRLTEEQRQLLFEEGMGSGLVVEVKSLLKQAMGEERWNELKARLGRKPEPLDLAKLERDLVLWLRRRVNVGLKGAGVVKITATTSSPELSLAIARSYAQELTEQNRRDNRRDARMIREWLERRAQAAQESWIAAENVLVSEQRRSGVLNNSVRTTGVGLAARLGRLAAEVSRAKRKYEALRDRLEDVAMAEETIGAEVTQVEAAELPTRPAGSSAMKLRLMGIVLGVALGVGMVVLLELLSEPITLVEELENDFGLPVLGTIPVLPTSRRRIRNKGRTRLLPHGPAILRRDPRAGGVR
ncbi:MAG: hypothetical protein ACE5G2_00495 [Candidatus Krumholzibacteriia bacterium]